MISQEKSIYQYNQILDVIRPQVSYCWGAKLVSIAVRIQWSYNQKDSCITLGTTL